MITIDQGKVMEIKRQNMPNLTPILKSTSAVRVSTRSAYSSAFIDINNISVQVFC